MLCGMRHFMIYVYECTPDTWECLEVVLEFLRELRNGYLTEGLAFGTYVSGNYRAGIEDMMREPTSCDCQSGVSGFITTSTSTYISGPIVYALILLSRSSKETVSTRCILYRICWNRSNYSLNSNEIITECHSFVNYESLKIKIRILAY
jgi:hypothetical protein